MSSTFTAPPARDDGDDQYDGPDAPGAHDALDDDEGGTSTPARAQQGGSGRGDALDGPAGEGIPTDLAAITGELQAAPLIKPRTWDVDTRPGFSCTFHVDVDGNQFRKLRKRAEIKGGRRVQGEAEVDEVKLGQLLIATYCTAINRNGSPVLDSEGEPVHFRHAEFQAVYGVRDASPCVQAFFGLDGAVVSMSRMLITAAGWLDDPDESDSPTPR